MKFRDALEIYLIGPISEDLMGDVLNEICGNFPSDLEKSWKDNAGKIEERVLSKEGKLQPDFVDDNGAKRLRIKTLIEITGLPPHDIIDLPSKDFDPRFVDAMDFISLNKCNFIQGGDGIRDQVAEAHATMMEFGPPDFKKKFENKFKEIFGEIPFDYVDEAGEKFVSSESLANFLGITIEEVNEQMETAVRQGHVRVMPGIPDPEDGNVH